MQWARWAMAGIGALVVSLGWAGAQPAHEKRSGSMFMSPETRAIQNDDTGNPGMLWVLEGERLWQQPQGQSSVSCSNCHGDASDSMRGVAARYPAFDDSSGRPIDLAGRINLCRRRKQSAEALPPESEDLLALTAYVARQSRGLPISPSTDARLVPFRENGRQLFESRIGQLDLACSSCHDDNWRGRLGGSPITQGHPTAYPIYRLEWQGLGSLQRRMRGCMVGVRAEPFGFGAAEFLELELYLMSRAQGLAVETPGVRP